MAANSKRLLLRPRRRSRRRSPSRQPRTFHTNSQFRNGIITFPGGVPLYKGNTLVGGIGVSGDAVDQDEAVAFAGAAGFAPGPAVVKLGFSMPSVPGFP